MEAIILAGGFGTRLQHIVSDVPKPMAPVAERPFLQYIVDELIIQGVTRIIMAVHYKKECIMDFFGEAYRGIPVLYSVEDTPLFTGGAIKKALTLCAEDYAWVINGDTYFEVPMKEMEAFTHQQKAKVAIAVKEMENFSRYGKVEMDGKNTVTAFCEKAPCEKGCINGGIYYLNREILADYPEKFSLESDCFPNLLTSGDISAFESKGYFIDIGVPEDYYRAQTYFEKR